MQELDSRLDQLAHRRHSLPEVAEIEHASHTRRELTDRIAITEAELSDLSRDQRKADADVEQVRARRARDRERLDRGEVGSPKELAGLQHEVESLTRRLSNLEDVELEVMERVEATEAALTDLRQRSAETTDRLASLEKVRDAAFDDIDAEAARAVAEREQAAATLPADLQRLYTRLREQYGGVGVAALKHRRCTGCQLQLTAADLSRLSASPADEVLRCEECGRILVRTDSSGA